MKNLKKVLALVLVVATLMGFATVASAADFTDAKSIEHKEAVDVMKMIGVINGLPNGSFNPNGQVDRATMAQMVAMILNKGEGVSKTYAGANSFTDCVGHWASGAIALASSQGIISGVGNGLFKPNDPVTGAQASRMLVSALGYDTKTEGIGGAQWATKAVSVAKRAGLLDGLDGMNVNAVLTRDQASQMMFNALKADMVQYDRKADSIDLTGIGSINLSGSTATAVANDKTKAGYDGETDGVQQLCEEYFPDLKLDTNADDEEGFDVAAHAWNYKKASVGPYTEDAEIVYTAAESKKDIKKDINKYIPEAGMSAQNAQVVNADTGAITDGDSVSGNADAVAGKLESIVGNGKIVRIYVTDNAISKILVIAPKAAKVTIRDYKATSTKGARTNYAISGVGNFDVFSTVVDDETDTAIVSGDVQDGKIVTYYQDGNSNLHIFATTEVTGVISKVSKDNEVTLDGTKYKEAATPVGGYDTPTPGKDEATLTLDQYGYIVKAEAVGSDTLYGLVLDNATYSQLEDGKIKTTAAALIATAEGKVETIDTNNDEDAVKALIGKVVTYELRKGKYDVAEASTSARYIKEIDVIEKDSIALKKSSSTVMSASGKTLYVFANFDKDDNKPDGTVTTYTGYKNVPAYDTLANSGSGYTRETAIAVDTDEPATGTVVANVVFVYSQSNASEKSDYVYVTGEYTHTENGYEYDVIVDGKLTQMVADRVQDGSTYNGGANTAGTVTAHTLYKSLKVDGDGNFVTVAADTAKTSIENLGGLVAVSGEANPLEVKDDDVMLYEFVKEATEEDDVTASLLKDLDVTIDSNANIYLAMDSGKVTAVYVLYTA